MRATIYGPDGVLGQWTVHDDEARTDIEELQVRRGDVIDFVVDCLGNGGYDSYWWSPMVALVRSDAKSPGGGAASWSSKRDFASAASASGTRNGAQEKPAGIDASMAASMAAWERYAHVLLMSNEFAFIQ